MNQTRESKSTGNVSAASEASTRRMIATARAIQSLQVITAVVGVTRRLPSAIRLAALILALRRIPCPLAQLHHHHETPPGHRKVEIRSPAPLSVAKRPTEASLVRPRAVEMSENRPTGQAMHPSVVLSGQSAQRAAAMTVIPQGYNSRPNRATTIGRMNRAVVQ